MLTPRPGALTADPVEAVREALEHPLDTATVGGLVRRGDDVLIPVDDHTRPTPAGPVLSQPLKELEGAGLREPDITIPVANGAQRSSSAA